MTILPAHQCHLPDWPQWGEARRTRWLRPRNLIATPIARPHLPRASDRSAWPGGETMGSGRDAPKLSGHPGAKTTALGTGWPRLKEEGANPLGTAQLTARGALRGAPGPPGPSLPAAMNERRGSRAGQRAGLAGRHKGGTGN